MVIQRVTNITPHESNMQRAERKTKTIHPPSILISPPSLTLHHLLVKPYPITSLDPLTASPDPLLHPHQHSARETPQLQPLQRHTANSPRPKLLLRCVSW